MSLIFKSLEQDQVKLEFPTELFRCCSNPCARKAEGNFRNPKQKSKMCAFVCVACKQEAKTGLLQKKQKADTLFLRLESGPLNHFFKLIGERSSRSASAGSGKKQTGFRMKQHLATQKQQMSFLDRKCSFL